MVSYYNFELGSLSQIAKPYQGQGIHQNSVLTLVSMLAGLE